MLCNGPFPKCFLQNLKQLKVRKCGELKETLQIDEGFYTGEENQPQLLSNLEHLELESLPELRWIWKASAHYFSLQSLKVVKISRCEKLMSLFSPSLIQSLLQLEELQIEHCDKLKTLFGELESDGETESIIHLHPLCLPRLTTLIISYCARLEYVLPITLAQGLPQLEKLKIQGCDELKTLYAKLESDGETESNSHLYPLCLTTLTTLFISGCKRLEYVLPITLVQGLPQLEELEIKHCDNFKTLFGELESDVETESNRHLHPLCLPRLTTLFISNCERLEYVLPITLAQGLPQLKELEIEDCNKLKTLFGELESDGETESNSHLYPLCLPTLRTLFISDCERLEYVLPITSAHGLPQLEELKIEGCDELKQVFGVAKENGVEHCIKLPRLKDLTLYHFEGLSSFCPENYFVKAPALEKLSVSAWNNQVHFEKNVDLDGLTSLKLRDGKDLECLADITEEHVPTSGMFTNLVELVLQNMFDLKMLCNGQPPKGFLQNLETLTVEGCVDIASLSLVAQNLKKLTVYDSQKLQEVFRIDELHYIREENQTPLLSNLDYLELRLVPELRWVLKGSTQYVSLGCLKVVLIQGCFKLESLFSTSLIRSLRLLEELVISSCDKLETVFAELESDDETESNTLCLPNLKILEISECPRLKYVWPLASTLGLPRLQKLQLCDLSNFDPERYFIKSPALDYLEVIDCPGLSNFTIQQDKPLPSKLRSLWISGCEKLDQIIVNDMSASSSQGHDENETSVKYEKEMLMFPELELLSLEGLPSLTSFCPVGYHLVFPSLNFLKIEDCSKMITSFTIDSTLSVHAETKAPLLDDISPSNRDIHWRSGGRTSQPLYVEYTLLSPYVECTSLPPYVEEADEISELK